MCYLNRFFLKVIGFARAVNASSVDDFNMHLQVHYLHVHSAKENVSIQSFKLNHMDFFQFLVYSNDCQFKTLVGILHPSLH